MCVYIYIYIYIYILFLSADVPFDFSHSRTLSKSTNRICNLIFWTTFSCALLSNICRVVMYNV